MALFESYERREKKILGVLKEYGIKSIEQCRDITLEKGIDGIKSSAEPSLSALKTRYGRTPWVRQ